jgi:AcrR family transcriptional regulator
MKPVDTGRAAQPALDRRVERTREALRIALMDLMVERGWDGIDVQTLCGRANIGRSTFYQHFPNKEELLKASFAGLKQVLLAQAVIEPAKGGNGIPLAFVPALVAHVHEAQQVFRALLARRSGHYVQDRFRELLVELFLAELPSSGPRRWQDAARAHYLAGALFELLAWWLGSNRPHRPQEIEALFKQWSTAVLTVQP